MHFGHIATKALLALSVSASAAEMKTNRRPGNPKGKGTPPGQETDETGAAESYPCDGAQTSKILQPTDTAQIVGCVNTSGDPQDVYDGFISDFTCEKDPALKFGHIIITNADRYSIIEGFRVYANTIDTDGANFDPIKYKVEGRGDGVATCYRVKSSGEEEPQEAVAAGQQTWRLISKGNLPANWRNNGNTDRNIDAEPVVSTFDKGDTSKSYTAVKWINDGSTVDGYSVGSECRDYRISFEGGRVGNTFAFGEIELVGTVTSGCPNGPVTSAPTKTPTPRPTEAPNNPNCPDIDVANVLLPGDNVEVEGCLTSSNPEDAFDGTTDPFTCVGNLTASNGNGIIVSNLRKTSIATGLRIYAGGPNSGNRDPVAYKVEGREGPNCYRVNNSDEEEPQEGAVESAASIQTWRLISKGELPWIVNTTAEIARNTYNQVIDGSNSTNGDSGFSYTAVTWVNDGTLIGNNPQSPKVAPSECRDYRITFGSARDGNEIEIGEVELVGIITDSCTLTAPTSAPFGGCGDLTRRRDCRDDSRCQWKKKQCINLS